MTAALVLSAPVSLLVLPATGAQAEMVTKTVSFDHACRVDGNTDWDFAFNEQMQVSAPDSVRPGEEFKLRIQPGEMKSEASKSDMGWLKYDFEVPKGADLVAFQLMPNTAKNLSNGESPKLIRIGSDGIESPTGGYLRITGTSNSVVRNGPSATTNDNDPLKGLRAPKDSVFRFPGIELTLKAKQEGVPVTTAVRKGAAQGAIRVDDTSISFADTWTWAGNSAGYCVPLAPGNGVLSTTEVYAINQTATSVDVDLTALTGDDVKVAATVEPNPGEGHIELFDGDRLILTLPVDKQGHAETVWKFAEPGEHPITAKFVGTKKFAPSVSDEHRVVVAAPGVVVVEPEPEPGDPEGPAPTFRVNLAEILGAVGSSGSRMMPGPAVAPAAAE